MLHIHKYTYRCIQYNITYIRNGSGIWDPRFQTLQTEIMRTDRIL